MAFGGRGNMGNMNQMIKQAQAMQAKMQQAQEELKNMRVTGSAGGGAVSAVVNGQGELQSVKISRDVVDPEEVEFLEDLVLAAVSDAANKAREQMEARMSSLTGGLKLPF